MTLQAKVWIHKNSGKQYRVIDLNGMMKIDGKWERCVVYKSVDPKILHTFVRPTENFAEKFVEVTPTYTGVRGHEPFSTSPNARSRGQGGFTTLLSELPDRLP